MGNSHSWRNQLSRDIRLFNDYRQLRMPIPRFLDTELILTLLVEYLPNEEPTAAWAVLGGHVFPALERLPNEARRAITIARRRLPEPLGRGLWERTLKLYQTIPRPYPLYRINGMKIELEQTSFFPERRQIMLEALQTIPPLPARPARYASHGRYRFYVERDPQEVEIPKKALETKKRVAVPSRLGPEKRSPLRVSLAQLKQEADWMDEQAPGKFWGKRVRDLNIALVDSNGLTLSTELMVDGLLHLIGMLGSGKSTLFIVLTVYLARRGQRVTIVQSDVASLLELLSIFETLRPADEKLLAVPFIGRSTRVTHLNRLHRTESQLGGLSLSSQHPAYEILSTVCPLDGWRRDVTPIPAGSEPCTRLYPHDGNETATERCDCPFLPSCPVHLPARRLAEANIWLATPASLLVSSPQAPLIPHKMRYIELVMRYADVLLVDEADLVQIQFDDRFAPFEVLVGPSQSWLDRLAMQVTRQVYRPGRPIIGRRPTLDRWLTAHRNTQRTVDCLYRWLRESSETRAWLGQTYFSGQRLLQRVADEVGAKGVSTAPFRQMQEKFSKRALGSVGGDVYSNTIPSAWTIAVQLELFEANSGAALAHLAKWLRSEMALPATVGPQEVEELAHRLLIALIVAVLDRALQDVISEWPATTELLNLNRGQGGLFYHPSNDLVSLVPEAPMGAVLGFQYFDTDNNGSGELRFFHIRGVGRHLLVHVHDAYRLSDYIDGPHVILTSGTSWAPSSWRYHLQVPPGAVLLPEREDKTANTTCFFEPLTDPDNPKKRLYVSGQPLPSSRHRSLRAMVKELARPRGMKKQSMFDIELATLPGERRRILLVVGSYEEAKVVGETLLELLAEKLQEANREIVLTLIPDSDDEVAWQPAKGTLLRSMLAQMPKRPAQFLVAPLMAIERGHNILVGQEAAIGSVYFLTRPMPRPGDPHAAVQQMNAWAAEEVPRLVEHNISQAGRTLREAAYLKWDQALREKTSYKGSTNRTPLLWTQLVLVWQCIGRLLRGGVSARVHFIDAKWAEVTAGLTAGHVDTEETSMLLGFKRILEEALAHPDPAQRAIAEALYGPFASALANMKGVYSAE